MNRSSSTFVLGGLLCQHDYLRSPDPEISAQTLILRSTFTHFSVYGPPRAVLFAQSHLSKNWWRIWDLKNQEFIDLF